MPGRRVRTSDILLVTANPFTVGDALQILEQHGQVQRVSGRGPEAEMLVAASGPFIFAVHRQGVDAGDLGRRQRPTDRVFQQCRATNPLRIRSGASSGLTSPTSSWPLQHAWLLQQPHKPHQPLMRHSMAGSSTHGSAGESHAMTTVSGGAVPRACADHRQAGQCRPAR
jgi:hypothetical protein